MESIQSKGIVLSPLELFFFFFLKRNNMLHVKENMCLLSLPLKGKPGSTWQHYSFDLMIESEML